MKIKINSNLLINLIVIIGSIFFVVHLLNRFNGVKTYHTNLDVIDDLKPIDTQIPDSLPHRDYKRLTDSIASIRNLKNGDIFERPGPSLANIGIVTAHSCSNCSLKWFDNPNTHIQYYIKLYAWKLPNYNDDREFYVENNQGYLRKGIIDISDSSNSSK
jgi:hypothetical protein